MMEYITILNTLLLLSATVGGFFAFKNARRTQTVKIQDETIHALQQQIDAIQRKLESQEKENARLQLLIDIIREALGKRGIHVTIDGEMVTIEDVAHPHQTYTRAKLTRVKKTPEAP